MQNTHTPEQDNDISAELKKLAALISPLTLENNLIQYVYYLLLLWGSLRVYQIEPYVPGEHEPKITRLPNGWIPADYEHYLASSAGENYGSYCTGKLTEASQEMINILANRGAKVVGIVGHPVAARAAWMECVENNIAVSNFYPNEGDLELYNRIQKLRQDARKSREELAQKRPQ